MSEPSGQPKFPTNWSEDFDDPEANPIVNVWPVFGWLIGAGLAFGAAILAFRRLERGRQR